jgi:DNA-binding NarL/FixJ family response regulator
VRKHISNIYEKLHVTSKTQVVKLALKNKWV